MSVCCILSLHVQNRLFINVTTVGVNEKTLNPSFFLRFNPLDKKFIEIKKCAQGNQNYRLCNKYARPFVLGGSTFSGILQ